MNADDRSPPTGLLLLQKLHPMQLWQATSTQWTYRPVLSAHKRHPGNAARKFSDRMSLFIWVGLISKAADAREKSRSLTCNAVYDLSPSIQPYPTASLNCSFWRQRIS